MDSLRYFILYRQNGKKFEDNKGLDFWAKKENLKTMTKSLVEFRKYDFKNIEDLQKSNIRK